MKRIASLILLFAILMPMAACGRKSSPVQFYFQRREITYGAQDSVIIAEDRPTLSRDDSLSYLLTLYLEGPIDSSLILPVPPDTQVLDIIEEGERLTLIMNDVFFRLDGVDLTLACACLGSTCFDLTAAQEIVFVNAPDSRLAPVSFTLSRTGLILTDMAVDPVAEPTQTD